MRRRPLGARSPVDLHPDDLAARIALRDHLIHLRIKLRLSCWQMAPRIGWANGNLYRRESDPAPNWELVTAAAWANALGHHFHLVPNVPNYASSGFADTLEAIGGDDYQHAAAIERLIATRRAVGLSQGQLGYRIDLSDATISRLEDRGNAGLTATWQKYCRGLGGRLDLVLTPFESDEVAA